LSASRLSMPSNASSSAPGMSRTDGPSDSPPRPPGHRGRGCCRRSRTPSPPTPRPCPNRSLGELRNRRRPPRLLNERRGRGTDRPGERATPCRAASESRRAARVPCATHRGRPEVNASGRNATLHAGAQQRLVALSLDLGVLETRPGGDPTPTPCGQGQRKGRRFLRRAARRRPWPAPPAVLSARGPAVALESLAARATAPVHLTVELEGRVAESVEVAAYFVVSESLAKVCVHARVPRRQQ